MPYAIKIEEIDEIDKIEDETVRGDMMVKAKNEISSMGTVRTFWKVGTCSEALFNVIDRASDHPLKTEEHASTPFAGGILQHGWQCGQVWGASLAAGAQAYRLLGSGPQAETGAIIATQKVLEAFRACSKNRVNCHDITGLDKSSSSVQMMIYFLIKGGAIGCFRMAARFAPLAFNAINSALAEKPAQAPSGPVSCSALLVQKMGLSDMHSVTAAGLAGGIGLSGEACGALGAAIWIIAMNCLKESADDNLWKSKVFQSRANDTIEKFLKCTDHAFECSKIVGRKFENVSDHADYLRGGGCSKILEGLIE